MSSTASSKNAPALLPAEIIAERIFLIRGQKVMLDEDLAKLYGIYTARLNEQVRRNITRFPEDFSFQLTKTEYESLMSQIAISNKGRGGRRKMPTVFTEHGVAMLSSVLRSSKAVEVNILIIRAFIRLREILASNKELAFKVEELERIQRQQNRHINTIYELVGKLIDEPVKPKGHMGF